MMRKSQRTRGGQVEIEFYYDIVCPYAYLASTRLPALAAAHGARLRWSPVLLGGLFKHVQGPQNPGASMSPARAAMNLRDMDRWADYWGVPLRMPAAHPRRSVDAMRLLVVCPEETRPALSKALFQAYWVHGADVADRAVLGELAARFGLPPDLIAREESRQGLIDRTAAAAQLGLFGVPAFRRVPEPGAESPFFWGQDRLGFLSAELGGDFDAPYTHPAATLPVPAGTRLELYHDFSSPFAALAVGQAERFAADRGVELVYRPMLLGALFRAIGTADVPLYEMNEAKRRYYARDLADWASRWGVPIRFPDAFPLRTVTALRVALAAPAATGPIYRAAWVDNRDVGQADVLTEVLDAAGLPGAALVERATTDTTLKDALRANTERAATLGACGAPTWVVRRPDEAPLVFWGQDRLPHVAAALGGWRAPCDREEPASRA